MAVLSVAVAASIAGCGGGDDAAIPEEDASQLLGILEAVEGNIDEQACDLAVDQANNFVEGVAALPSSVEGEVRRGLEAAGSQLVELTSDPSQCEETTGATGPTETVDPVEPVTPTTTPTTETTTLEETTVPEEEEEEPAPPANEDPPTPPTNPGGGNPGGGNPNPGGGVSPTGGIGEKGRSR